MTRPTTWWRRVLPDVPIRHYVLSPPSEMVGLLAARGEALSSVSRIFVEVIFAGIRARAREALHCGAVVLLVCSRLRRDQPERDCRLAFGKPCKGVQRFTKALITYPHLHVLVLDGGYRDDEDGALEFREDVPPSPAELRALEDRVASKFAQWLKQHGLLDEEGPEEEELDGWWTAGGERAVRGPCAGRRSTLFAVGGRRPSSRGRRGQERHPPYLGRAPLGRRPSTERI